MRRTVSLLLVVCWLVAPVAPRVLAADSPDTDAHVGVTQMAKRQGPIMWHYPEGVRNQMENDLEMLRLYNQAAAAKKRRKTLGLALFIPGAVLFGGGLAAGIFQGAIGLYNDETGDYIMAGGLVIGAGLIAPGVYFTGWPSGAEKRYKKYLQEKYGVEPILYITPRNKGVYAQFGFQF
ncbi:MAG: hypothetical protein P9L99_06455 [Candidatus Lernaella stagnicola]|nr:hypothetical protein [Candidatus Lernaella stagnicola]